MTYRPLGPRVVAYVAGVCMVTLFVVIGFALPADVRDQITVAELVTLVLILLAVLGLLGAIANSSVHTDDAGVHIRNGFRRHELVWGEILAIELGRGAPWAAVDTSDGQTVQVMAIQGSDGRRARVALARLRTELASRTAEDDA